MSQIAEYLSRQILTTENQRFNFPVPETVYDDLLQCFSHAVCVSGKKMQLIPEVEKVLRNVAAWMKSGKSGLLLCGKCGTGKTKVMQALSYLFHFYENERNTLRVHSAVSITEMSVSKEEKDVVTYGILKTSKYVGIDDLGTEPVNVKNWGTDTSPVIDVIYHRYNTMKVTVLSTNLNMERIGEKYGERISDRICEQYDRIIFNFQSFRQR